MNNPLSLRLLITTLAGVLTLTMVACSKPADTTDLATPSPMVDASAPNTMADSANAPASSTTMGTEIDDTMVTTRVKTALLDNTEVKGFDIQVETRKGEVLLSGFVDNQTQIDRAANVARGVEGVKNVNNKLSIKDSATTMGGQLDDSVITTKVKADLLADTNIKSLDIAVTTHQGEVQLSGFVNNQGQMDRAVEIAQAVTGVTQVGNKMSIKK